jgi:hypothetical protein
VIISPLNRTWPFIWTNLNSLHPTQDNLYQVWLNLACWFWRRRFLKIFSVFYTVSLLSPLHLNKLKSPPPPRMICAKSEWFRRRCQKCKKFTMDRQTDTGQWAIRKDHLIELSVQVS